MKRILAILLVLSWCLGACAAPLEEPVTTTEETAPSNTGATSDGSLELGDTMPDLTLVTTDGEAVSLSRLLQEKKLVVLNFWFADCSWCLKEFPALEVAYQRNKADVEVLALNPVDSTARILSFRQEHHLSFPTAACSRSLALSFGINGYPTSVFIDRNGTICLIHTGAITDVGAFQTIFDTFTADDYQQTLYTDTNQLLTTP